MNYGGGDQRYNGGGLTDGYDYEGEKNYYGQQSSQQLYVVGFPFSRGLNHLAHEMWSVSRIALHLLLPRL
jgi:hypothetical protein